MASRIGQEAENALEEQGIGAYVIPDLIDKVLNKLIAYVKINELIDDIIKQNTEYKGTRCVESGGPEAWGRLRRTGYHYFNRITGAILVEFGLMDLADDYRI